MNTKSNEAEILRLVRLCNEKLNYLVRITSSNPDNRVEHIKLTGQRLRQYNTAAAILSDNPLMSRYEAANRAFDMVKGGFPSAELLYRYILRHKIECPATRR